MSNEPAMKPGEITVQAQDTHTPAYLMAKAVEGGMPVETIEKLMDLEERYNARKAREAFYLALSDFQGECPPIKKDREVKNKDGKTTRFKYANMDDIVEQVAPLLQKHGFSYITHVAMLHGEEHSELLATVEVNHKLGHSEKTSFSVPIDKDAFMNDQQKRKSARTFALRVAFQDAFGIVTADDDDEAQANGSGPSAQDIYRNMVRHMSAIRDHLPTVSAIIDGIAIGDLAGAAEAYYELDDETKKSLWLAPTKGGIFSTEEREVMKSREFRESYYGVSETEEGPQ